MCKTRQFVDHFPQKTLEVVHIYVSLSQGNLPKLCVEDLDLAKLAELEWPNWPRSPVFMIINDNDGLDWGTYGNNDMIPAAIMIVMMAKWFYSLCFWIFTMAGAQTPPFRSQKRTERETAKWRADGWYMATVCENGLPSQIMAMFM